MFRAVHPPQYDLSDLPPTPPPGVHASASPPLSLHRYVSSRNTSDEFVVDDTAGDVFLVPVCSSSPGIAWAQVPPPRYAPPRPMARQTPSPLDTVLARIQREDYVGVIVPTTLTLPILGGSLLLDIAREKQAGRPLVLGAALSGIFAGLAVAAAISAAAVMLAHTVKRRFCFSPMRTKSVLWLAQPFVSSGTACAAAVAARQNNSQSATRIGMTSAGLGIGWMVGYFIALGLHEAWTQYRLRRFVSRERDAELGWIHTP